MPVLDVKVVNADTDRFGVGHGYNSSPSEGTRRRWSAPPARSATRHSSWPGWRSRRRPTASTGHDGAFRAGADGGAIKTIADLALYAHGTGALPPGVEGGLDAQTVYRD